jgi:CO/xanthine dehydrogenase Mo-binding subunit
VIGEAHPRLGGERFVAGTGRFVDDVHVPGMLHAAVLRSPHAHARLVSIDTKRARDLRGVHAVLTAADVPPTAIIPNRVPAPKGTDRYLQPAIARDVVRFVGEPVALVVADDRTSPATRSTGSTSSISRWPRAPRPPRPSPPAPRGSFSPPTRTTSRPSRCA